jgi:hypothetical protein
MNNKYLNILIVLLIILVVVFFIAYIVNRGSGIYLTRSKSGCRCMRQPGGKRGYCGICGTSGTAYGCPAGQGACGQDCKAIRYSGKACDPCRDPNC